MFRRVFQVIAPAVGLALLFAPQERAQSGAAPRAFRNVSRANAVPDMMWTRGVRRVQSVAMDGSLFSYTAAKRFSLDRQSGAIQYRKTELNMFSDVSLVVDWTGVGQTDDQKSIVWTGSVEGRPLGHAVMVVSEELISANISAGDGRVFQIRTLDDGSQFVIEVNTLDLPPEGPTERATSFAATMAGAAERQLATADASADDGSTIDVLVLYTPAVTQKAGGANAIRQQIEVAVAETNLGYQNSGVIQRVRLVYSQEVQYTESGKSDDDVARLVNPNDGYMDIAHRLRDLYAADLVSVWVSQLDACGQAADILTPSAPRPDLGFNVVEYTCATTNLSFAHELGHNMGAAHDRDHTAVNSGAYRYSYGYAQDGVQRTIMAYPHPCECPRLNYWSNPSIRYNGYLLGISEDSSSGTANYRTLNNTRSIVANFRATAPAGGSNGLPESDHPYVNNLDKTYTYTAQGSPSALNVTFDGRTSVENGYDYIHIADGSGRAISGSPFTGTTLANRTVTVPGGIMKIRLVSDGDLVDYGFRVTSITPTGGAANLAKLAVTALSAPTTATMGVKMQGVRVSLTNQGTAAAGAFRVGFYYSQDQTVTTSDVYSGSSCTYESLAAGASTNCSGEIGVPNTLTPGVWYFASIADDQNQLQQSDRGANVRTADSGTITIGGGVAAELVRPTPNSLLSSSTATFQWSAGTGVSGYSLAIGTRTGGNDVFSGDLGTALSVVVSNLPTNGSTLFVTLTSRIGNASQSRNYTLLAANIPEGNPQPKLVVSAFSAPTSATIGNNLKGTSLTITNQGRGDAKPFRVGFYYSQNPNVTTRDVFSGWYCSIGEGLGKDQSTTCGGEIGVPTTLRTGQWYLAAIADDQNLLQQPDTSGSMRVNDDGPLSVTGVALASIISPANGTTLSSSSVLFRWDSGSGAEGYYLYIGTTAGGKELYEKDQGLSRSAPVSGIPVDGRTLYVRLWTRFGSDWYSNDYTYRAFNAGAAGASPHIVIKSLTAPNTGTIGANLQGMQVMLANQSNVNAGPFRVGFYYSQRTPVTTGDIYSGWFCDLPNGLTAGTTYTCSGEIGVSTRLSPGRWYLAAIADDTNRLQQADRSGGTRVADSGLITLVAGAGGSGGALPESAHPYADNENRSWTYVAPGNPRAVKVSFSSLTSVEEDFDFIYIYDSSGAQIPNSPFTGAQLAGKTLVVSGATVRIRLTSDDSVSDYGFKVTAITDAGALPKLVITAFTAPTRGTIGVNLPNMSVNVVNQGDAAAPPFRVGFYLSKSQTVTPYDVDTTWYCAAENGLEAGASFKCGGELGIPSGLPPGSWYLAAIADDDLKVDQSDRRGNSRTNDNGATIFTAANDAIEVATSANEGTSVNGNSKPKPKN